MVFFEECDDMDDCFYHRLYSWPVPQKMLDVMYSGYDGVKGVNPTIGNAFSSVEDFLGNVVSAPLIAPAYSASSKIGARTLAFAESKYPALSETTPEEIKDAVSKRIHSGYEYTLKPGVDGVKNKFAAFFAVLYSAVEYSENFVETHIANDLLDRVNVQDPFYWRTAQIPYRAARGVYTKVKLYGASYYAQFLTFVNNVNAYAQNSKQYVVEKKDKVVESAAYVAYLPADLSLRGVKTSTYYTSQLSAYLHGYVSSMRFVPQIALYPLDYANAYVQEMNNSASNTNSLTELGSRIYNEAAHRVNQAKVLAQSTIDGFQSKVKSN